MAPPTYKDIQRATGLSLATISKYFNGGSVREANRVAIEDATRTLGFRVNGLARSLRTRRSGTIGVLLPDLNNDFHTSIIAGVEETLRPAGISVLVCSGHQEPAGRRGGAVELLLDRQVDGIIAVPPPHEGAALRTAAQRGVPLVLVDRLVQGLTCDAVVLDNPAAADLAIGELLRNGHREIAVVTGPSEIWTMSQRLAGVRAALRRAGIPIPREFVVSGPLVVETGTAGVRRLLAGRRRPTAIFATNYELTLGALIALNDSGVDVPGEISFVGFDSREVAGVTRPRTTVVVQPVREISMAAAELALRRLVAAPRSRHLARTVTLPGELLRGDSVTTPAR